MPFNRTHLADPRSPRSPFGRGGEGLRDRGATEAAAAAFGAGAFRPGRRVDMAGCLKRKNTQKGEAIGVLGRFFALPNFFFEGSLSFDQWQWNSSSTVPTALFWEQ